MHAGTEAEAEELINQLMSTAGGATGADAALPDPLQPSPGKICTIAGSSYQGELVYL